MGVSGSLTCRTDARSSRYHRGSWPARLFARHAADLGWVQKGAKDGKGRGRQVIAVARTCNVGDFCLSCAFSSLLTFPLQLILIVLDVLKPLGDLAIIQAELEGFGIRLNKQPPQITVKKKERGGISITNTVPLTKMDPDEIRAVLGEYRSGGPALE